MKLHILALAVLPAAIAAPGIFSPGSVVEIAGNLVESAQNWLSGAADDVKHQWSVSEDQLASDLRAETVSLGGIECKCLCAWIIEASLTMLRPLCRAPGIPTSPLASRRAQCL